MNTRTKRILFILTAVLVIVLPLQQLNIIKFRSLKGVVEEQSIPSLTYEHWKNQQFQRGVERYLQNHYGFREPLTRLYNQTQWDLLRYSNMKNKGIFISDDHWYFESMNVEEYYQGKAYQYSEDSLDMAKKFDTEALMLYQIQHILEEYDTHLFVLLLPGKETVYPEHLPENTKYFRKKDITAYDYYGKKFAELGVNYIDVGQWFLQMKDTVDYLLFPQTGTHWSNLAAMHVADSLIRYMEALGDMNLLNFSIGEKYVKTMDPDNDLEQLMNLIRPLKTAPNYYAETKVIDDSTARRPILITIGDSFYWNILNHTPFKEIFSATPYWYYYSTVYFEEPYHNTDELDLVKDVLDADFVMLAYSTPQLYKMSNGFSTKLLPKLCYDEDEIRNIKTELVASIHNNKAWLESLKQRAERYQIPIDTTVVHEAEYVVTHSPHIFLPALKDSIPTKRSSAVKQYIEQQHLGNGIQQ